MANVRSKPQWVSITDEDTPCDPLVTIQEFFSGGAGLSQTGGPPRSLRSGARPDDVGRRSLRLGSFFNALAQPTRENLRRSLSERYYLRTRPSQSKSLSSSIFDAPAWPQVLVELIEILVPGYPHYPWIWCGSAYASAEFLEFPVSSLWIVGTPRRHWIFSEFLGRRPGTINSYCRCLRRLVRLGKRCESFY